MSQLSECSLLSDFAFVEIKDHIRDEDTRAVQAYLEVYSGHRNLYLRGFACTSLGLLTLYSLFNKKSQSYFSKIVRKGPPILMLGAGVLCTAIGVQALGIVIYGLNHHGRDGHTLLHHAILSGNPEIIQLLYGRNIGTPQERVIAQALIG